MTPTSKQQYFDELAERWDELCEPERVAGLVRDGLEHMGLAPDEHVVDLGCGTGILAGLLLEQLGPAGSVTAVDFSPGMLERAKEKIADPRVRFVLGDAAALPLADEGADRVICLSTWPHLGDPNPVIAELWRVLVTSGVVCVWHVDSRQIINQIHRSAAGSIRSDLLEPAARLVARLTRQHFVMHEVVDDEIAYRIVATKGAAP